MKKLMTILMLMNSLNGFAHGGGDKVGNGGDVIVCPEKRTELLDLFQGEEDWGFIPAMIQGSREEIIREIMAKFQYVDPGVAKELKKRALEINSELIQLEKNNSYRSKLVKLTINELLNISDEGVAELPQDCRLVQAATQVQNPFPKEVKFTFQKGTWLSLDADVQAALILHEVIYEHMIKVGENSSRSTRYFNAALHAGAINTVRDYFEISSLFDFRNLGVNDDGKARYYGPRKKCSIERRWYSHSDAGRPGGTTIIVNRRNVIQHEEHFHNAVEAFHEKYASRGLCD